VTLELEDGMRFKLGANAVLDVDDIRKIQQRELFMYLMSQKIDHLDVKDENTPVKVGNVSIVHGDSKQVQNSVDSDSKKEDWYILEINGAMALYDQQYFPNTIIKFIKIQNKYDPEWDMGKIDYYIGKSFEALNDQGQAQDAFKRALDEYNQTKEVLSKEQAWVSDARETLSKLNQE
jgi:hypothetical protein